MVDFRESLSVLLLNLYYNIINRGKHNRNENTKLKGKNIFFERSTENKQ